MTPNERFDLALRRRTRHWWLTGVGLLVGGPVAWELATRAGGGFAFLIGGGFMAFIFWAFRTERALQVDLGEALEEKQRQP